MVIIIPFAALSIMSAFVVLTFLPETLGHSLKETIEDIEGKSPSRMNVEIKMIREDKDEDNVLLKNLNGNEQSKR